MKAISVRIGGQAFLGAIDQAVLAAAHFMLGVLVGRLGGVAALGGFAFAYSLIVLVNMLHTAVIAEIYSVEPGTAEGMRRHGAWPIVLVTSLLVMGATGLLGVVSLFSTDVRATAWSPAFMSALLLSTCYWSVKPLFYRQGRPFVVLGSTLLYGAVALATAWAGYHWKSAAWQPLWSIAAGALVASTPMWCAVKRMEPGWAAHLSHYLCVTWRYAKWAVPAAVLIWINSNGYLFAMPLYRGAEETGGLRAVLNVMAPINTLLVGACTAWLPMLADMQRTQDASAYRRTIHRTALGAMALTCVGACIVFPLSASLIGAIYGKAFLAYADALRIAAWLPALWVAASIYRAAIRAQANARDLCRVYAMALLPVGIGLMIFLSPYGAVAAVKGMLATQLLVVVAFIYVFQRQSGPDRRPA